MNKCIIKFRIFLGIISLIISFIFIILNAIFTIWTHISLQILFYIGIFALCSVCIFFIFIETSLCDKYLKNLKYKLEKDISLSLLINIYLIFYFFIIFSINFFRFDEFIINCPFYLDKLEYSLNFERRCELYNINYNSRYSYQYICSYYSSLEFDEINIKKHKQEIKPNKVICIIINELIDNDVINNFKDVYNKKDNYYCSRTNMPQENDYSFAKAKDCTKEKYDLMFLLYLLYLLYLFLLSLCLFFLCLMRKKLRNANDQTLVINNILARAFNRIHNDLSNLGRYLNLRRERVNSNNTSKNSTERGENPGEHIDFRPEKTINIIIENKKQFIIDQNIKNISNDKKNKPANHINSENINDLVVNSEERIIKFSNINNDN